MGGNPYLPMQALLGALSQESMEMMDDVGNQLQQPQKQYSYNQHLNYSNNGFDNAAATWASAQHWTAPSTSYSSRAPATSPPSVSDDFHMREGEGGLPAHGYDHNHYQDGNQNQGYGHSRMVVYEDKCDSPECHVPECHEPDCVEELVECTDPHCLPEEVCNEPDLCHNNGASICAGSLEVDVISAAAAIASMKPPQVPMGGPGHYFQPTQDYSYCMELANGQWVDVNMNHPRHIGACMFTNAYVPSYTNTNGRGGIMGENGMCHYINPNSSFCTSHQVYHNINQPSFQNSTLQYAMSLRDLSSRASSSQDPFTFSTEQTPSSASTYSSPHRSSLETPSQTTHSSQLPPDNSPVPICQWQDHPNAPPCGLVCPSKAALQSHIQSTHTAPLSKSLGFICRWSGCSRLSLPSARSGFAQRSKLDRHMQSHTGHKACKCPLCHHEFSTSQTLESHMRTHTGDKPFKCREPDCGYEAAQASQLTMHTRTKHTREKPLVCDEPGCGRRFAESSNLSKHRKIHEPEEECRCAVCGKGFRRRDQLRRHGKIHLRKEGGESRGGTGSVVGDGEQSEVKYSTSAILPPGTVRDGPNFSQLPRRALTGGSAGSGSGVGSGMGSSSASAAPSILSDPRELEESRQLLSPSPTIGEFNDEELEGAAAMMAMDHQNLTAPPVGLVQGGLEGMD